MLIAAFVLGNKNLTRVTDGKENTKENQDLLGKQVAKKASGKTYYVCHVAKTTWKRKEDPFLIWHVGEGFEHKDGWWTTTGEG